MNLDIAVTLLVLGVAVLLLTTYWIRPEATAILVLAALAASGQVTTEKALSGFSSSAVISIVALLIISAGLVRSGAVHWAAARLQRFARGGQRRLLLVGMVPPALLSGVVNIVAAVSTFIPAILPALENSGTIDLLSGLLTGNLGGLGPRAALVGVGLLAVVLTQPLHSSVVAVILTPLALGASDSLGVNPMPFAVTVMVGASASYLMPVGHPAPLLVQRPGQYSAADYFRFGIGPVLLVLAVMALLIPLIWPL